MHGVMKILPFRQKLQIIYFARRNSASKKVLAKKVKISKKVLPLHLVWKKCFFTIAVMISIVILQRTFLQRQKQIK
jgi:hypothetical protein